MLKIYRRKKSRSHLWLLFLFLGIGCWLTARNNPPNELFTTAPAGAPLKIGIVGIIVSILNQILKHSGRDDQAYLVSMVGLVVVLSWVIPYIYELFQEINRLLDM